MFCWIWKANINLTATPPNSLEFVVHPDKSLFKTVRSIEYLGFTINSKSMTVSLTQEKSLHKTVMLQSASGRSSDHWENCENFT